MSAGAGSAGVAAQETMGAKPDPYSIGTSCWIIQLSAGVEG